MACASSALRRFEGASEAATLYLWLRSRVKPKVLYLQDLWHRAAILRLYVRTA